MEYEVVTRDWQGLPDRDLQVNGTKLECNFRTGSYLRLTTPVRFLRILASVIAWSLLTVFIRR